MCKVSWNVFYLLTVTMSLASAGILDLGKVADDVKQAVDKEVSATLHPVAELGFDVVNVVCPVATGLLSDKEPDLSELNMQYRSPNITIMFKLSTAADEISRLLLQDNRNRELVIFFPGFTDDPSKTNFGLINGAFENKKGEYIVLALDSSSVTSNPNYVRDAHVLPFIGNAQGKVVVTLHEKYGLSSNKIHFIGHSLGAHMAGLAAKYYVKKTGERVGRITGLDPAGPCLMNVSEDSKLTETDANFVINIHTDKGVFGTKEEIGVADFYPNGGYNQPGCADDRCSHQFVVKLMADSITSPEGLLAVACDSMEDFRKGNCNENKTSLMGFFTPNTTRGTYYLQTNSSAPFGLGEEGIHYNDEAAGLVQNVLNALF